MLALSAPADKSIRAQVAESVALIAELDFPNKWDNLIDVRSFNFFSRSTNQNILQQLVFSFSQTDYNINVGVLQTAHSIFQQWRVHVQPDELYSESEINLVL